MMQSAPQITAHDVDRVVHRDFHEDVSDRVTCIPKDHGSESGHREPLRVRMAALKQSHGDVERLSFCISQARRDYRDLLIAAEYLRLPEAWV